MANPLRLPSVAVETSIGDYAKVVELDTSVVARMLNRGGLGDEKIEQYGIFLSDEQSFNEYDRTYSLGEFDEDAELITIRLGGMQQVVAEYMQVVDGLGIHDRSERLLYASYVISKMLSDTLVHEVGHVIDVAKHGTSLQERDERHFRRHELRAKYEAKLKALMVVSGVSAIGDTFIAKPNSLVGVSLMIASAGAFAVSSLTAYRYHRQANSGNGDFSVYAHMPSERRAERYAYRNRPGIMKPLPLFVYYRDPADHNYFSGQQKPVL